MLRLETQGLRLDSMILINIESFVKLMLVRLGATPDFYSLESYPASTTKPIGYQKRQIFDFH